MLSVQHKNIFELSRCLYQYKNIFELSRCLHQHKNIFELFKWSIKITVVMCLQNVTT